MSKLPSVLPRASKMFAKTVSRVSSNEKPFAAALSTLRAVASRSPSNSSAGTTVEQSITLRKHHSRLQRSSIRSPRVESSLSSGCKTLSSEMLLAFAASSLAPHKVPKQVCFITECDLPQTTTGKYKRRELHEHLGVEALDLVDEATFLEPFSSEVEPPPVKPNPAIYGIRFIASLWVVFVHVGVFPFRIHAWRTFSITMPTFFILAGFLLESSTTREITDHKRFFRNRLVAAHPIYLMSMLFAYPAYILSNMNSKGIGWSIIEGTIYLCLSPFGLGLALSGPAWFMHNYYLCVAMFPYTNKALNNSRVFNLLKNPAAPCCTCLESLCGIKCIGYIAYPMGAWISLVTAVNAVIFGSFIAFLGVGAALFLAYFLGFPLWFGMFVCGMLTFRVFEHNHRGIGATERAWRHWGKLTDGISLLFIGALASQSYLAEGPADWGSLELDMTAVGAGRCSSDVSCGYSTCTEPMWDDYYCYNESCYHGKTDVACAGIPNGFNLTDGAICLNGMRSLECGAGAASIFTDYHSVPANLLVGMFLSRPFRIATPIICLYMYGLAVGKGITAKALGSNLMVKWLAPAAYPVYLFHWPLAQYWLLLRDGLSVEITVEEKSGLVHLPMSVWEFLLFVPLLTMLALLVAHVFNSYATAVFNNVFDVLYCCCPCVCGLQGRFTDEGGQNALFTILDVISGLTGADVDGTTPISQLGLDSFGASALVGILASRVPDVRLKAADVYQLETVGDIAALIERRRGENNGKVVGPPVQSEV